MKKLTENKKNSTSIIILFGPSGSGKSYLRDFFWSNYAFPIKSITTREKRSFEDNEYIFVSREEFLNLKREKKLININMNYNFNSYGILKEHVLNNSFSVIISDISSVLKLREELLSLELNPVFVYCTPPSEKILLQRHIERNTPERFEISRKEIENHKLYLTEIKKNVKVYEVSNLGDCEEVLKEIGEK